MSLYGKLRSLSTCSGVWQRAGGWGQKWRCMCVISAATDRPSSQTHGEEFLADSACHADDSNHWTICCLCCTHRHGVAPRWLRGAAGPGGVRASLELHCCW